MNTMKSANGWKWKLEKNTAYYVQIAIKAGMVVYTVRPRKKETHKSSKNFLKTVMIYLNLVYIVTKFHLSSFFWHQLQDVLAMHGRARTISNGDVKIDLRKIWVLSA